MSSIAQNRSKEQTAIDALSFEAASEKLEEILAALESGELSLEESIALYEQGAALANHCENTLDQAELRVRQWQPGGEPTNFSGWEDEQGWTADQE